MQSFQGIKYNVINKSIGKRNVIVNNKSYIFKYPCENTSFCTPYKLLISPGYYLFELWGACGGNGRYQNNETIREDSGGKGAYVSGKIALTGTQIFYIYIGGKGEDQYDIYKNRSLGGFNGGGAGGIDLHDTKNGESSAGGGGATDVRLILGQDLESWKSRIIVAAGGGGAVSTDNIRIEKNRYYQGGHGGKLQGNSYLEATKGGTQTSGFFGYGQDGLDISNKKGGSTGGGGGGYYGGTSIKPESDQTFEAGGAGGSSFISGYQDCNAVKYQNKDGKQQHSNQPIHYKK